MRFEKKNLGKLLRFRAPSSAIASGKPEAGSELARRSRLAPIMALLLSNGLKWPATAPPTPRLPRNARPVTLSGHAVWTRCLVALSGRAVWSRRLVA